MSLRRRLILLMRWVGPCLAVASGPHCPSAASEPPPADRGLVDVNRFVEVLKGNGWKDPQLRPLDEESRLVEAAEKAHRLTEALRRGGWQAWEFHDRDSSIVCVGGVDQLTVAGPGGRAVPHPEIARIAAALGPDQAALEIGRAHV